MGRNSGGFTLTKTAFWSIVIVAIAWIVATIFSALGIQQNIAGWLMRIANALTAIIALILAYSHIRNRDMSWHIIYWLCAVIVIVLIILPGFNLW